MLVFEGVACLDSIEQNSAKLLLHPGDRRQVTGQQV